MHEDENVNNSTKRFIENIEFEYSIFEKEPITLGPKLRIMTPTIGVF